MSADPSIHSQSYFLFRRVEEPLIDAQQEEIRELAYRKWQQAGCPTGDGFDYWVDAEREVTAARQWIDTLDI